MKIIGCNSKSIIKRKLFEFLGARIITNYNTEGNTTTVKTNKKAEFNNRDIWTLIGLISGLVVFQTLPGVFGGMGMGYLWGFITEGSKFEIHLKDGPKAE